MKIAVLDDYQDGVRHLDCFKKMHGHDVLVLNHHIDDPKTLAHQLHEMQGLILIRERTWIHEDILALLPNLRLIVQTGKAGRHLDLEACRRRGIQVKETEGTSIATGEFTLLMILAALRHFPQEVGNMEQGRWQRTIGRQLHGRTLAILGLGRIGEQLAHVAQAMGARVLVWGRENSMAKARAAGWEVAKSREDFFARADVLCITLRLISPAVIRSPSWRSRVGTTAGIGNGAAIGRGRSSRCRSSGWTPIASSRPSFARTWSASAASSPVWSQCPWVESASTKRHPRLASAATSSASDGIAGSITIASRRAASPINATFVRSGPIGSTSSSAATTLPQSLRRRAERTRIELVSKGRLARTGESQQILE